MSKLHDKDWLEEQYVKEDRSVSDIAEEAGETRFSVAKWIRRYTFDSYKECGECGEYFKNLSAHESVHEEDDSEIKSDE